jgi:hypothetical protein
MARINCYRINCDVNLETFEKIQQLKRYNICKSKFIRNAIEAYLSSEMPKLKAKINYNKCPF